MQPAVERMFPGLNASAPGIPPGVYPLMQELGCGEAKVGSSPSILRTKAGGGRIVLDIGLGETAGETLDAVKAGFVVIAFEPMPSHIHLIRRRVLSLGMQGSVRFVDPVPRDGGTWLVSLPTEEPTAGGFAYIVNAALDATPGTVVLPNISSCGGSCSMPEEAIGNVPARRGNVPTVSVARFRLDDVLPAWVDVVLLLKLVEGSSNWMCHPPCTDPRVLSPYCFRRMCRGGSFASFLARNACFARSASSMSCSSFPHGSCAAVARAIRSISCTCCHRWEVFALT